MKNESSIFTDLETDHGSSQKISGLPSKSGLPNQLLGGIKVNLWTGFRIGAENMALFSYDLRYCKSSLWNDFIDVDDEMCWRQRWDVGDGFGRFRHQHPLSFKISVGHQHSKYVTNIEMLSLTPNNFNIKPPTSILHQNLCSRWECHRISTNLKPSSKRFKAVSGLI